MSNVAALVPKISNKDKDGSEDEDSILMQIIIEIGLNGYVVNYEYPDEIHKYVFSDFDEVLKHIRSNH
jgi:hypothetical protein